MLDRADAGADRALRALGAVGMRRDGRAVVRGLLDRGAELGLGQLRCAGDAAAGEDGAGRDALDDVGAADEEAADAVAHLVGARDDPEPEVGGDPKSCASPTTSPPPHGAVTKAPAHCIRGPSTSPASMASRRAQSTNARKLPRSRTEVKPARRSRARAARR